METERTWEPSLWYLYRYMYSREDSEGADINNEFANAGSSSKGRHTRG